MLQSGEHHRAPHGEELGQLRGQPVAVEVVGGAGLDEGVGERQVAGDLAPADRAELDHAVAQGAERPRIDPAELGLAEAHAGARARPRRCSSFTAR